MMGGTASVVDAAPHHSSLDYRPELPPVADPVAPPVAEPELPAVLPPIELPPVPRVLLDPVPVPAEDELLLLLLKLPDLEELLPGFAPVTDPLVFWLLFSAERVC